MSCGIEVVYRDEAVDEGGQDQGGIGTLYNKDRSSRKMGWRRRQRRSGGSGEAKALRDPSPVNGAKERCPRMIYYGSQVR